MPPSIGDALRERVQAFGARVVSFLGQEESLEAQSEAVLLEAFSLRLAVVSAVAGEAFWEGYVEKIVESMTELLNYHTVPLAAEMDNALDFCARVAVNFQDGLQLSALEDPKYLPYIQEWLKSSLQLEVAIILGDYCLGKPVAEQQHKRVRDFLKQALERFGAYSILMDVWHPEVGAGSPQYLVNMQLVARAIRLKNKYPHLQTAF